MSNERKMNGYKTTTHIVIAYNHATKKFTYDDDGTWEWIRKLFTPVSNTWSDERGDWLPDDEELLTNAVAMFEKLLTSNARAYELLEDFIARRGFDESGITDNEVNLNEQDTMDLIAIRELLEEAN